MTDNSSTALVTPDPAVLLGPLAEAERLYVAQALLTAAEPAYRDPEGLCWAVLEGLFGVARAKAPLARWRATLAVAAARRPGSRLPPLLAGLVALEEGDPAAAAPFLRQALAGAANDLLAQDLLARCGPAGSAAADAEPAGRFCKAPFENLETAPDGRAYFCCPAWLPKPIGDLAAAPDRDAVWNSPAAQEIRASILDGSYRYCSRMHCPHLAPLRLPRREEVANDEHRRIIAEGAVVLPHGPRKVVLSHDRSCNLSCPSCRTRLVLARKDEQARLDAMAERVLLPLLADARRLHVTGSGDPFGSAHFRHLLGRIDAASFPRLRIDLQTNGQLLDEAAWGELGLAGLVEGVRVSIDAAREDTYAVLRRGGSLPRLLRNLEYVAGLRRAGEIAHLRLDVVVQALNFRELPAIARLARSLGCDGVKCQLLRNWGTFTPEAFARANVGSPDHPDFPGLLEVLRDPALAPPYVELWGMGEALRLS